MALGNYINIPATATVGGAPIDAFQGDAFRQNDLLFEQTLRSLAYSLLPLNNGVDGAVNFTAGTDKTQIWRTTTATINTAITATPGVPLIIMASSTTGVAGSGTITLSQTITAAGAGTGVGHLGGSGGGGSAGPGQAIALPISGTSLVPGGVGANPGATPANTNHFLRALPLLPVLAGGGAGGASGTASVTGGAGGGVVVLIADTINWTGGGINVAGSAGSGAGGGGGGGGAIIMIAKTFTPSVPVAGGTFVVTGGASGGAGAGAGGAGLLFTLTLP